MAVPLGVLFALAAMFAYGISDILIKKVATKLGPYFTYLYRSVFTVACLFAYFAIAVMDFRALLIPSNILLVVLVMTLAGVLAYLAYCKAIQIGKVSIISPVSHVSVLLTVLLAVIFFKESLTNLQTIAVVLTIAGIIGVSFRYSDILRLKPKQMVKGLPYALITILGWGIAFFIIKIPIGVAGPFITALYLETLSLVYLGVLLPFKKIKKPSRSILAWTAVLGAFVAIGMPFHTLAIKHAGVALANPVVFAAPAVTIVLAFVFLKERLEFNQLVSVLAICAGIVLAAI